MTECIRMADNLSWYSCFKQLVARAYQIEPWQQIMWLVSWISI